MSPVPSKVVKRFKLRFSVVIPVVPVILKIFGDMLSSRLLLRFNVLRPVIPVPINVVSFELENVSDEREVFELTLSESRFVSPAPVNPLELMRFELRLRSVIELIPVPEKVVN